MGVIVPGLIGVTTRLPEPPSSSLLLNSNVCSHFVPWFHIELYRIPFESQNDERLFARRLLAASDCADAPSNREEPGKYLWWLWQTGASLEGIRWYVEERAKYQSHGAMAAEYPSDDVEAFVNSGAAVFDKYAVEALRPACARPPRFVGEIFSQAADSGPEALSNLKFKSDAQGLLRIWNMPDPNTPSPAELVADRYLAVVDVGGRSAAADWSVIVVFDRILMLDGGKPAVVAQWRDHTDMDLLAWRAAQIAAFYDNALLVIESNTLETHDRDRDVDGDQSSAILAQIKDVYPNLYARKPAEDAIRQGLPLRYGFHTNVATKPMIISTLVKVIRESLYVERDTQCLDEYLSYEKKPNGTFGAKPGAHDDLLMTRAIGLHICFHEMPLPQILPAPQARAPRAAAPLSAASFF